MVLWTCLAVKSQVVLPGERKEVADAVRLARSPCHQQWIVSVVPNDIESNNEYNGRQ